MMNEISFQLEMAAFQEKLALGELEEAKSHERVKEIAFQLARFQMEWLKQMAKEQQAAGCCTPPPEPVSV
jgi:hypothetical protein